jgi:hypothetical protein
MKSIVYLFLLGFSVLSKAQIDTIYIVKSDAVYIPNELDDKYKNYLERTEVYTNRLWKINLIDAALLRINLAYEQKLSKLWSIEAYLGFGNGDAVFEGATGPGTFIVFPEELKWTYEHQFKYYNNLNRRKRLGKNIFGPRGKAISASFWYENYEDNSDKPDSISSPIYHNFNLGLKYTVQRRFAKIIYTEFFVGIYYRWSESSYWVSKSLKLTSPPTSSNHIYNYSDYFVPVVGV